MGTSKYLDSVLRILPAVQARQVYDLLLKLQVSGQIKDSSDYQAKLLELTSLINSTDPVPSFERIRALVWNLCSSDMHNTMFASAKNDIEALFMQVNEIGEKLADHNLLFMEALISDLANIVNEQEETILRLQWLKNSNNEFTAAISNTFSSSTANKTERNEAFSSSVYFDNRTYVNKPQNELPSAFVSEKGQKLILSPFEDSVVIPVNVKEQITPNSYRSEILVDTNTSITNIIDGKRGTFWTKNVYLSAPVSKVSTMLEFDLGIATDVNYIILEVGEDAILEGLVGVAHDGGKTNLLNSPVVISGPSRIDFPKNNLSAVLVTLTTNSFKQASYFIPADSSVHDAFDEGDRFSKLLRREAIEPAVSKAFASDKLAGLAGVEKKVEKEINKCLYSFVVDNIWFGNSEYENTGIFVSKPMKLKNVGLIGLNVKEKEETGVVRNTIEYDVVKIDRWPIYREQRFPILPLNKLSIPCERLVLTKKSSVNNYVNSVGALRFCPHVKSNWSPGQAPPMTVYKNGETLVLGNDWTFAIALDGVGNDFEWLSNFEPASHFENYTLSAPKMWIKILQPEDSAVYTVQYIARSSDAYSTDVPLWLTEDQSVSMDREGKVHFNKENSNSDIQTELYLQVTLRRNTSSSATTPELNTYVLLAAVYTG